MSDSRQGSVCLVIGAGDGLGAAIARAFAREGLRVCVTRRPRIKRRSKGWLRRSARREARLTPSDSTRASKAMSRR